MERAVTKLYVLNFKHYAPRGSQEGILGVLEAKDDKEVLQWLEKKGFFDGEEYDDDEPSCFSTYPGYLEANPEVPDRAALLGMERIDDTTWEGTKRQVAILSRSTEDEDWDNLYYGKTVVWWEEGRVCHWQDVATITNLGLIL